MSFLLAAVLLGGATIGGATDPPRVAFEEVESSACLQPRVRGADAGREDFRAAEQRWLTEKYPGCAVQRWVTLLLPGPDARVRADTAFVECTDAVHTVCFEIDRVWPLQQAERALAERVGEDLFRAHLVFLPDSSRFDPGAPECAPCMDFLRRPHFFLVWSFRVKGQPFVDTQVGVTVDEKGNLLSEVEGLPDCKGTPALCTFPVDEAEALRIARQERFAPGLAPWTAQFYFHSGYKRFVWSVSNVLVRGNDWSESGDILVIDATTGTLLDRGRWFAS